MKCPECGAQMWSGYGLAGGGGIGTYFVCPECDHFEKTLDPEMYPEDGEERPTQPEEERRDG